MSGVYRIAGVEMTYTKWTDTGANSIYYNGGRIGIGTSTLGAMLTVQATSSSEGVRLY